jgi:hypothetical protein
MLSSVEPPYTDPYVRWCGRGGAARFPPIPIPRALMMDHEAPEYWATRSKSRVVTVDYEAAQCADRVVTTLDAYELTCTKSRSSG